MPAAVLPAHQEGQEAGGQAEAGDAAAAAQGSISSPSSGPLGQRKPRQEGRAATSREAYKAPPPPAILPQSLSILCLHLAPFLGHGLLSLWGHSQSHPVGRHSRPSCWLPLSGGPVHRQTPAYLPPFRKSFLLSDLSPSCCSPHPSPLVLNL